MSTDNDRPEPDTATEAPLDIDESVLLSNDDVEDPPAVRALTGLLAHAVRRGASHVHIDPDEAGVRVRLRIDGQIDVRSACPTSSKPR